ncbi:hypothetical protein Q9L42_016800 [Methylomarinum sp. Ch1-1]|uniref:Uncharacterized protein n=1 Tax=Methylomarinum roseum TaxID=3067653 RepID=A0AAU7NSM4_9GAMM|nr:hypothetical protein [Methylomarinum sp. Ch1-1]MDP4520011.1 hypothetical protein [Methylomarinum sp. Ch1-1]
MCKSDPIQAFLKTCKELNAFCSQNGWIIDDSIRYEILQRQEESLLIYVTFLESIMEGSGCQCDQKSCYGRLMLTLDDQGEVISAEIV